MSSATFYRWEAKFGALDEADARGPKALEDENAKLKRMLAESMLGNVALKDLLGRKWRRPPQVGRLRRTCSRTIR
jgi:putative transposase